MSRQLTRDPQHGFDRLASFCRERGLRRAGTAAVIALDREPRLDAGGEIEAREGLVDAPELPLQLHRIVPAGGLAEIVELDALPWDDAGRARHPADAADQHHRR